LRLDQSGDLTGEAVFEPDGHGLRYTESGLLKIGEYEDHASRTYLYAFPEPHRAFVSFDDGRPFHELDFRADEVRVQHLCGDDVYAGIFNADSRNQWRVRWRVTGPRKDQRIASVYTRLNIS